MVKKAAIFGLILLATTSCHTDLFFGKVEGVAAQVYAPNGRTPVYDGRVVIEELEAHGYVGETMTGPDGGFVFPTVPDASYRVTITSANEVFETIYHIEVEDGYSAGEVEVLMSPVREGTFVNVPGRYDDMSVIFADLGYRYRTVELAELAVSSGTIEGADVVFLNSGVDTVWAENPDVTAKLRAFVEAGGRLMVSDRAWPFIRAIWPNRVTWPADPEIGGLYQDITADVAPGGLRTCVTVPTWELRYAQGNWALPSGTTGTTFISGDVETSAGSRADAPLLLGFAAGDGFVYFSTFNWRTQYKEGRVAVRTFNYLIANR
ncbi:MAG: DUF2012 domain-containing protein [Candidatus Zixiibacteriota bacterium]|jgi:hypothetical protein